MAVLVHSAGIQDRDGAKLVIALLAQSFPRLKVIFADGGYAGTLGQWITELQRKIPLRLEIVRRIRQGDRIYRPTEALDH